LTSKRFTYTSKLDFNLETFLIGNSEMQHLDFAYASSIIRTFVEDASLVLTIRGRKYTPKFSFFASSHKIEVEGVQTEVDAGYEGKERLVLIEAKNTNTKNVIIRQLFYPFKQWKAYTSKKISLVFFEKRGEEFCLWEYCFEDEGDYNSIKLVKNNQYSLL
jgi:hypothetical protein